MNFQKYFCRRLFFYDVQFVSIHLLSNEIKYLYITLDNHLTQTSLISNTWIKKKYPEIFFSYEYLWL